MILPTLVKTFFERGGGRFELNCVSASLSVSLWLVIIFVGVNSSLNPDFVLALDRDSLYKGTTFLDLSLLLDKLEIIFLQGRNLGISIWGVSTIFAQ